MSARLLWEPLLWLGRIRRRRQHDPVDGGQHLLVVRLDQIGDVVMTTAFLRELRRGFPAAWITLVVKPAVLNLVELCPYVDEVLPYDWSAPRYSRPLRRNWRLLRLASRHLWARRFDWSFVPRRDADLYHASFLAYVSGAERRVGYSGTSARWLTHVLPCNGVRHEVQSNLDVIRFIGQGVGQDRLELWLGEDDESFAEHLLTSRGAGSSDSLVAFGVGAGTARRIWPISRFVELATWLKERYGSRIVLIGGRGEEPLGEEFRRQSSGKVIDAIGRTTLRQTGAILKRCRLYVGNDAGPMHLAAAAGVPVVEISCHPKTCSPAHPNSPARFGPWDVPRMVLQPDEPRPGCSDGCASHEAHCILAIDVEQVKVAVTRQLAGVE